MYYTKFLSTLFFSCLLFALSINAQEIDQCAKGKMRLNKSLNSLKNTAVKNVPFSISNLEAHWEVNPTQRQINGRVVYTIAFAKKTPSFFFNLHNNHSISKLSINGTTVTAQNSGNSQKEVQYNFEANTTYTIEIVYNGSPRVNGGFYQSTRNGEPEIWTLSEPYDAQDWWPVPQQLDYKIDTFDAYITYPENLRSASNGLLIESTYSNGKRTDHWQHKHPINYYLIAIAVTNYQEYTFDIDLINNRKLTVQNLLYPELFDQQKPDIDRTGLVVRILDSLLTPYPFEDEKYGHAHFTFGGGMEHQTMSFMNNFRYDLLAHEAAHQWLGNLVTCGSWQDLWLNESFATYLNGASYEPWSAFFYRNFFEAPYRNAIRNPGERIFVDDTTNVNRLFSGEITYYRGAMVIRTLRYQMSDTDFWESLRYYIKQNQNSFARTKDLVAAFNTITGKNWTTFFQNFIYTEGYPLVDVYYDINVQKLLSRCQERTNSAGASVNYNINFPVKVFFENGDSTEVSLNTGNTSTVLNEFSENILKVEIDPDHFTLAVYTGLSQPLSLEKISAYPNPNSNGLYALSIVSEKNIVGTVYSSNGKKIKQVNISNGTLDISAQPAGKYYLELSVNGETYQVPLVRL